jgi:hypothetical protein
MRPITLLHRAGVLAATSGLALALASPVQAAPIERGFYSGSDSFVECGLYEEEFSYSGLLIVMDSTPALDGQYFNYLNNYEYRAVLTNPTNGKWMVVRGDAAFMDIHARYLEGTVYTGETIQAGVPYVIEDSSGRVVVRDLGNIAFSYVFDTLGDGEPGGEFLAGPEAVRVSGPHPAFLGTFDFCELADELIG